VPFELKATRNDYVHAFLGWFDIAFSKCHKPIQFSTGPHAKYTHWKQTVFYTPETITVSENETIKGTLSCAPNSRNNRDLDIVIDWEVEGNEPSKGSMTYKMS
jgi:protein arginine N-methyltransferase 1